MVNLATMDKLKSPNNDSMVVLAEEQLYQLQQVVLFIVDDMIAYCNQHGSLYSLRGGSALGTLRHQGFIPWDDDVDIDMPRTDYDALFKRFVGQHKDKYSVVSPELTPEKGLTAAHIRLRGTKCGLIDDYNNEDCNISVDLVSVENVYNNTVRRWWHDMKCMATGLLYSCRKFYSDCEFYMNFGRGDADFIKAKFTGERYEKSF